MDQGLASLWAGVAGLAGAGIGGACAAWAAAIGGRKAVEAAQEQEARAARAEHQHWQRQQRFDAFQELVPAAEALVNWGDQVAWEDARLGIARAEQAIRRVQLLGPDEVADAATDLHGPMRRAALASWALRDYTDPCPDPPDALIDVAGRPDLQWSGHRGDFERLFLKFAEAAREVLDQPPQ